MDREQLLKETYYSPEGLQGAYRLYKDAREKDPTITRKFVEEWLKKQEVAQVHAPRKEVENYFPIKSNHQDHIWQADLMDVSAQAHNNNGVNFLLCVVDIWSRYAFVRPLKNKEAKTVATAFEDILAERSPEILMSDNGSEFINRTFTRLRNEHNIRASYAEPGDHHRMGIVERFNKTIREALTKYMTAFKTKHWLDVLDKLVKKYNNTIHSSTGSKPSEPVAKRIEAIVADKEDKARREVSTFRIGDEVRSLKNKVMFEKGAMPKWSSSTMKVTGYLAGKRYTLDNGKSYLYYQIKKVGDVEQAPQQILDADLSQQIARDLPAEPIVPKPQRLALKKEGVEKANVREGLRERRPDVRVVTRYGEKINW